MSVSVQSLHGEQERRSLGEVSITWSPALETGGGNELSKEATTTWTKGNHRGVTVGAILHLLPGYVEKM